MAEPCFIQVILPLKLEWEPYYRIPEGMQVKVGDRVRVLFAGAFYVACVSGTGVRPGLPPEKIQPVEGVEDKLPAISEQEILFWKTLSRYYLCTIGEVYKAAYPSMKNHGSRLSAAERMELPSPMPDKVGESLLPSIREGLQGGKPVLLTGISALQKREIYLKLAEESLAAGKSVLVLVPEIALAENYPCTLKYHSGLSPARRKLVEQQIRTGEPQLILGTRSALFLPFRSLGLVIVDEEQDPSYKQDSPAPRYHARESAIMLASIHKAGVLLSSSSPSLESVYNAQNGRFIRVGLKEDPVSRGKEDWEIIDTGAEYRKKGMVGSLSLKLLAHIKETMDAGQQVLLVGPKRTFEEGRKLEAEVQELYPQARIGLLDGTAEDQAQTIRAFTEGEFDIMVGNTFTTRGFESDRIGLVALVAADGILSRQDFRADERAFQLLGRFRHPGRRFVIQTREPAHPVFSALVEGGDFLSRLLEERRFCHYPPYTRLVKLLLKDSNEKRREYLSRELLAQLKPLGIPMEAYKDEIRLLFPRDRALTDRKQKMAATVASFEKARKYTGHIIIDVDPA